MITKVILYAINITDLESHSNLNNIRIACFKTQRNVFLYIDLASSLHDPTCSFFNTYQSFSQSLPYTNMEKQLMGQTFNGPTPCLLIWHPTQHFQK